MADRTAIFIDGAYLDHVLKDEFDDARIDYQALFRYLAGEQDLLRVHYYHCPVYQGNPPTEDERTRYAAQRKFFSALERMPRCTVRLGRLAYRGKSRSGRRQFEQKRVDILLGVDLVLLSAKQAIREAVIVAGDSDFIPAVTVAKAEGVLIRLYHGVKPHADLWREADERIRFNQTLIDSVRLQPRLTPG